MSGYDCPTAFVKDGNGPVCQGTENRTGHSCDAIDSFDPSLSFFKSIGKTALAGKCINKQMIKHNSSTCPPPYTIEEVGSADFNLCVTGARKNVCQYAKYKEFNVPQLEDNICNGPASPDCSSSGQRYRTVKCADNFGVVSDVSKCTASKPATEEVCKPPPDFRWVGKGFGACDPATYTKTQIVECQDAQGTVYTNQSFCTNYASNTKPATSEACNIYAWSVGEWQATPVAEGFEFTPRSVSEGFDFTSPNFIRLYIMLFFVIFVVLLNLDFSKSQNLDN